MTIRRGESRPHCELCGAPGTLLHSNVRDHVHGIEGDWRYRRCGNPRCGLLWLDPPILEQDLALLYADYYTHRPSGHGQGRRPRRWIDRIRDDYIGMRFASRGATWFAAAAYLAPIRRMKLDAAYLYLRPRPQGAGRLLEIGCGNGERLQRLANCGWTAVGVDFDPRAVQTCREHGLDVRAGTLADQRFEAGSFDAILLNHVIEHVADPAALLAECLRLARPGARLVMATPNAASTLHRLFGRRWRGLEAPRHLRVFSGTNLPRLCAEQGWRIERHFTTAQMTDVMFAQSWSSLRTGSADGQGVVPRLAGPAVLAVLAAAAWVRPTIGEELVLELSKPAAGQAGS